MSNTRDHGSRWKLELNSALAGGLALQSWPLRHGFSRVSLEQVLVDRCVLVTGASSGIGRAVALRAAEANALVVLVARSQEKLRELQAVIESRGGRARLFVADLSSAASADALSRWLANEGLCVDVLINNAGRSIRRAVAESYHRAHDYERTMALNYFGSLRLILALLPGMRERKRGHIINVSSVSVQIGSPLFAAYVASKAALDGFTRVAAVEAQSDSVYFTTVHMPLVRTPMLAPTEAFRDLPALSPTQAAELVLRALITRETELGTRLGRSLALLHAALPNVARRVLEFAHRALAEREPEAA
ncbi:MAG TPA: SDR family NAD(P)-dependent oxidoreductase [Polyangiaceae bacterium]|nr:SDR family NAD(P)-dependent oxidoreductase [Polyangiaceae bacterium]